MINYSYLSQISMCLTTSLYQLLQHSTKVGRKQFIFPFYCWKSELSTLDKIREYVIKNIRYIHSFEQIILSDILVHKSH